MTGDTHGYDPFGPARATGGYSGTFNGEVMPVLTRWRDVRAAARDWQRFSNDGPGRVPVPDETDIRSLRQLPIEIDPPAHGAYKALVKDWFRRPLEDETLAARIGTIARDRVAAALGAGPVDVVQAISLPIQSHALAALFGLPATEAEVWTGWGLHAFKTKGRNDPARAAVLMQMIEGYVDAGRDGAGETFFDHLASACLDGRPLTREERLGFAHVAFAGGRDTLIHTMSGAMWHLAGTPSDLGRLRAEPDLRARATEEFVRFFAPLTHIGRICTRQDTVADAPRQPGERIALCWAAANFDDTAFDEPLMLRIDRAPNPHVGFGAGDHACLGAAHARAVIRALLAELAGTVSRIDLHEAEPGTRDIGGIVRSQGFARLVLTFHPR
jgi:cytochrome P450